MGRRSFTVVWETVSRHSSGFGKPLRSVRIGWFGSGSTRVSVRFVPIRDSRDLFERYFRISFQPGQSEKSSRIILKQQAGRGRKPAAKSSHIRIAPSATKQPVMESKTLSAVSMLPLCLACKARCHPIRDRHPPQRDAPSAGASAARPRGEPGRAVSLHRQVAAWSLR
jgi:hypothetical protein